MKSRNSSFTLAHLLTSLLLLSNPLARAQSPAPPPPPAPSCPAHATPFSSLCCVGLLLLTTTTPPSTPTNTPNPSLSSLSSPSGTIYLTTQLYTVPSGLSIHLPIPVTPHSNSDERLPTLPGTFSQQLATRMPPGEKRGYEARGEEVEVEVEVEARNVPAAASVGSTVLASGVTCVGSVVGMGSVPAETTTAGIVGTGPPVTVATTGPSGSGSGSGSGGSASSTLPSQTSSTTTTAAPSTAAAARRVEVVSGGAGVFCFLLPLLLLVR